MRILARFIKQALMSPLWLFQLGRRHRRELRNEFQMLREVNQKTEFSGSQLRDLEEEIRPLMQRADELLRRSDRLLNRFD